MEKPPEQPHNPLHHKAKKDYVRPPRPEALLPDMMQLAEVFLGPQFDERGQQRWNSVEDGISYTGVAVTDGSNYFIYGKSTIMPHGAKEPYWGLKRVRFYEDPTKKHLKQTVSTQAYRSPGEEFNPGGALVHLKSD